MPVGRRVLTIHDVQPLDLSPQVFYQPDPAMCYRSAGAGKGAAGFDASLSQRLTYPDATWTRFGIAASWTVRLEILFRGAAIGGDVRPLCRGVAGRDGFLQKITANTLVWRLGNPSAVAVSSGVVLLDSVPYVVTVKYDAATKTITLTVATATSTNTVGTTGNASTLTSYTPPSDVFSIGATSAGANFHTGFISNVAMWDRLTTGAEDIAMLNLGRGFTYSDVASVSGLATSLRYWFPLGTTDGQAFLGERVSGNTLSLTNVNAVAEETGTQLVINPADGDKIGFFANPGTLAATAYGTQPVVAARPVYRTNGGLPYFQLNGSAWIDNGTDIALGHTTQMWAGMLIRNPVFTDGMELFGRKNATEGWEWIVTGNDIGYKTRSAITGQWKNAKGYLADGNWHWIEAVRKDSSYFLYADGDLKASAIASSLLATTNLHNYVGKATSGGTPLVADVAYYFERDTAPTPLELVQLRRAVERRFPVPLLRSAGQVDHTRAYAGGTTFNLAAATTYLAVGGKVVLHFSNQYKLRTWENGQSVVDELRFHTDTPTALPWYACILSAKDGTQDTYTLRRVSDPFYLTSPGQQIVQLPQPLRYADGERLALYVPTGGTLGVTTTGSNPIYSTVGIPALGVETVFSVETTGQIPLFFAVGSGAKVGEIGDSNGCGRPPGTDLAGEYWPHYQQGGSFVNIFDPSANLLRRCATKDPRISVANYELGGQQTSWGISTGLPDLIAAQPKLQVLIIELGSNDIYQSSLSAASIVTNISAMITTARAAWPSIPIIVFGMYPFNGMTDTQAQIGLDTDAALVSLCAGLTNVTFFDVRGKVGKPRTSMSGSPLCSYVDIWQRGDDIHLNGLGQEQLAISLTPILQSKLGFA